jgi:BlaI family penicillinase repressor
MAHPDVPAAELEVLACLQRKGAATVSELREVLRPFRPLAHASVVTLLQRLERKGLVTHEKGPTGKAFIYRPSRHSRSTLHSMLHRLVQRAFGGDSVALVASLFESQPPTPKELEQVEQLLDKLRQKTRSQK